jgi:hypothetical protein
MESDARILDRMKLETAFKAGANWFFWIAGLSLVNSIIAATGKQWGFVVGLGTTQLVDAIAKSMGKGAGVSLIGLAFDILVLAVVCLFGVLCRRGFVWAFVLGMILYALDALIFLGVGDWFGLVFHGLVLFFLFGGLSALRKLKALPAEIPAVAAAAEVPPEIPPAPIEPK